MKSKLRDWQAHTAIILGSGLNEVVSNPIESIAYAEFREIPKPTVAGHAGKFSLAEIGGARVIFAQGRSHLYEGYDAREVTAGVRLLAQAGVKQLILTNTAGALAEKFQAGDWMMLTDHLNLTGTSPLRGTANFLEMSAAYSPALRQKFSAAANTINLNMREGVYAAVPGPQYETPAEVRMLQKLGADAVGMSTVLEAIQARALGIEVAAFSCITNLAAGISDSVFSHDQVLSAGKSAAKNFAQLLTAAL